MSFADNLQYLRRKEKITQEELADQLDVSRQSVSKWETGEAYPETDKLIALCEKFGVTMDDLVRGDVSARPAEGAPAESAPAEIIPAEAAPVGATPEGSGEKGKSFLAKLSTVISSVTMLICATVYVMVGIFTELWHPTWIIFLCGVIICIWSGSFADPKNKNLSERLCGAICGSTMLGATVAYLLMGFLAGLWHPGWVVFLAGTTVCAVVGVLLGKDGKRKK